MSTQQYKRHAHHELSYVEIRRRLHLDPTQLHPIIGFIESECIKHGIPQSGHNMTALVPWQNAQKHVLEAVLNDVVKKFMPATFPPVGTSPEDARNALRAIVHNIRRAQRERNTRRESLLSFPFASSCKLMMFPSERSREESSEVARVSTCGRSG